MIDNEPDLDMSVHNSIVVIVVAGALCVSAQTHASAQEVPNGNAFALTGDVSLAPSLDSFDLELPQFSDMDVDADSTLDTSAPSRPTVIDDRGSASALPWYERFTLAPSASQSVWARPSDEFRLQAGDRWGVTLGYSQPACGSEGIDLQDFSAGAFISFSDHFRFGGELRFTSPEETVFGEEGEEKTPEIRFESAFRF